MTVKKMDVVMAPAEIVEDPEETVRRQADFSEEERKLVEEMTAKMGMTNNEGELLHEELEEWNPFEEDSDMEQDEDEEDGDEMDYE